MQGAAQDRSDGDLKKLRELIKGIDFGMLTTVDTDGTLRSRPMSTNGDVELDGDIWFFTRVSSHKVDEISRNPQVNVSFANPDEHAYISLTGRAQLVQDQAKINELWKPILKAWFPNGKDDPDVALLKVEVEKAEFWDSPGGLAQMVGIGKALLTGEEASYGENKKLDLAA